MAERKNGEDLILPVLFPVYSTKFDIFNKHFLGKIGEAACIPSKRGVLCQQIFPVVRQDSVVVKYTAW